MLSILAAAGYKVGRYTSPHLIDWRERICLNSQWISDQDFLEALVQVQKVITKDMPTQFEVITAAMWWYFAKSQVDIAVIETGLGGRLDATNVCDRPLVSVITSISRDHWQRLGDSLGEIASEKAGIIKPNRPVVVGELPQEALDVIRQKAASCHAPITVVETASINNTNNHATWQGIDYPLALLGKHQLMNSAIALGTIQNLQAQGWNITPAAITQGMAETKWQGRLQWSSYKFQHKSYKILLDGAHNLAAAEYLRQFVDEYFAAVELAHLPKRWIIGMLETKDHAGILRSLLQPQDLLFIVPIANHQSVNVELVQAIALDMLKTPPFVCQDLKSALESAFSHSDREPVILCGSLYLVGEYLASEYPA